jgi:hypothetical protein
MTQPNVTGYRVFVGTTSGAYTTTFDVPADKDFFIFRNAFMGVRTTLRSLHSSTTPHTGRAPWK